MAFFIWKYDFLVANLSAQSVYKLVQSQLMILKLDMKLLMLVER